MPKLMRLAPRLSIGLLAIVLASNVAGAADGPALGASSASGAPDRAGAQVEERIREKRGLPAVDAARLRLWSFFGTVGQFADGAGLSRHALGRWLADRAWELPTAPALALQNKDLAGHDLLRVSSGKGASAGRFVARDGRPAQPATGASIDCDRDAIIV